tara:strand:- start:8883 stop:9035 length:153 start_codon:yes stop_codon:yes gene_type:complete
MNIVDIEQLLTLPKKSLVRIIAKTYDQAEPKGNMGLIILNEINNPVKEEE